MEEPNSVCTIFFFNLFGFNFSPLAAGCFIFSHLVSLVILKAVNFDDGHINWNSWIDSKRRAQCASLIDALHQLLSGVTRKGSSRESRKITANGVIVHQNKNS